MSARVGKVAIASCPDKVNYGSVLQSYALQRFVERLGYETHTIDKSGLGAEIARGRRMYYAENLLNFDLYHAKLGFVGHRVRQHLDRPFGEKVAARRAAFERFVSDWFAFTPRTSSFEELSELCDGYDAVIVGSDQLWLPVNIAGGFYALSFVGPSVRKISYATSFGVAAIPEKYVKRAGEFLSDFAAVSVREDAGADIVERATGRRPEVVCDPAMLLSKGEWRSVATPCPEVPEVPYILCYFLGKNVWNRVCAVDYARRRGLKVVVLAHLDEYVAFDESYADACLWNVGPDAWLSLVLGASAVFTDSFHGTLFSCLFEVPFFTFRRHANVGAQSTNARLDTLLTELGACDRMCESEEQYRAIARSGVGFEDMRRHISAYRARSVSFLEAALAGGAAQ